MGELLSCPFCRELFAEDEGPNCPDCELPLVPLRQLPLSHDGKAEALQQGVDPPEDQTLPQLYMGRSRGALLLTSLAGLGLFWAPWVSVERPDSEVLSGFDLASSNAPWLFGGAVGWFILVPLLLSRRSVSELRGIRVIATLFCAMTLGEASMLLLRPPQSEGYFSIGLEYQWGLFGSALVALVGGYFAMRLGGSLADLRDLPVEVPAEAPHPQDPLH